mgnify:CR=1 FL=1
MPPVPVHWIRNASDRLAIEKGCWFDESAGELVIQFVETFCVQSKGRWGGKPLTLLDWQKDFLMRLFGWRRSDGSRRFRRFYLEVAKKNGKSTMISAILICFLLIDGEAAPEVYCNAVDRSQASIIFDEAARMVRSSPELSSRLNVIDSKKRIIHPESNGVIIANSADVASKDGINASHVLFDELHRQKDRKLWEVMEYAGASREQPLMGSITTAGESCDGVWFEQREYSEKVNDGVIPDIAHLGVVYRALESDDIDDPATWRKANPSLGVTINEEDFARELAEAKEVPAKLANFKRLRLNIVVMGDAAFVHIERWDACNAPPIFAQGDPIFAGLDLSSINDLSALVWIAGDEHEGFDVDARFWLPEDDIVLLEQQHGVPYREWAEMGLITLTPGNVIDYSFIRAEINVLAAERDLRKLLVDPYNATKLAGELKEQDGLPVEYLRQGFLSLSAPTKSFLRLILSQRLRHGGNPLLRWCVSNAVAEQDAAGGLKLSKRKSRKKIDGAAALVNAIAAATTGEEQADSVYESRGILTL